MPYDLSPEQAAREAGLVYSDDSEPGYSRRRSGKGYSYYDETGDLITDKDVRERCNALAIPPAYEDVWICPNPRGHLQATGRDAKGRKTYRYHDLWREARDQHKFSELIAFGMALSGAREQNDVNLRARNLSRERVLAGIFHLLDSEALRIGSPTYLQENGSYGATTLTDDQVEIQGHTIDIHFIGKGGRQVDLHFSDRRLERLIRRMSQLPGQHLFRYEKEGESHPVSSSEVNEYLRELFGCHATAKQFRTWSACICALDHAGSCEKPTVKDTLAAAAERLHNTPAICRKSYVHPQIVEAVKDGSIGDLMKRAGMRMPGAIDGQTRLSDTEKRFLTALKRGLLAAS
ncbi:DNA topoisomerase IB [Parvularcula flava]|uniref:DNA topoisomerase I n=1 Tax=Aquisalinus luteolus TaxID=1566827 RepID=A0A8J3A8S3_9PROT|nr:DNA topoisomerase IB [Aquisalinus luteolus]NHK29118.1 DNA topoisomerase IB [Aquisalinus luteolus]GGI00251.1 DNA topoisomerase I [Aquisalinus luteolus]